MKDNEEVEAVPDKEAAKEQKIDSWRVENLNLNFVKGYEYASNPEDRPDHYDGSITFANQDKHAFRFALNDEFAREILAIIGEKVADASLEMAERMIKLSKKTEQ